MMLLLPAVVPALNFDLDDWKLQLPVDDQGRRGGAHSEVVDLADYESEWFRTGPDGAMVLIAPVDGGTTPNARAARTELREMAGDDGASWSLVEGGWLSVALTVDRVPATLAGDSTEVVVGQIHGGDAVLARLTYAHGTVYWVQGRNEARPHDVYYNLLDAQGRRPSVALGEPFAYSFDVQGGSITVALEADGTTYRSRVAAGEGWDDNGFYFKAGVYLQSDETTSTGSGRVSIYGLAVAHDGSRPAVAAPPLNVADRAGPGADPSRGDS